MLLVAAGASFAGALAPQKASARAQLTPAQGQRLLATRSAHFIENKGQWDPQARFLARVNELDIWFTDQGIRYDHHLKAIGKGSVPHQPVAMSFVGGRAVAPVARHKVRGRIDFLKPGSSALNVGAYAELFSKGVYPGIDVRNYYDANQPRYDLIVAPGARPSTIKLGFKGDNGLSVVDGKLRVSTKLGGFANGKPFAYQMVGKRRVPVAARWALLDKHTAGFKLGAYDASKPLVIDPLIYGSFVGGNGGADEAHAVVADDNGGVFVTGVTYTPLFPTEGDFSLNYTPGRFLFPFPFNFDLLQVNQTQSPQSGGGDAFLFKLQGDAFDLDYSAFIGGSNFDSGQFLRRDIAGNVWLAGLTASTSIRGASRDNIQILSCEAPFGQDAPDDGAYRLYLSDGSNSVGRRTAQIRFDATAADVESALNDAGIPATVTQLRSRPTFVDQFFTVNPFAKFAIDLGGQEGNLRILNDWNRPPADPDIDNSGEPRTEGLTPSYRLFDSTTIRRYGSIPTSGTFTITIRTTNNMTLAFTDATTAPIPFGATAAQIATAITTAGTPAAVAPGGGGQLSDPNNEENDDNQVVLTLTPAAGSSAALIKTDSTQLIRSSDQTRVGRRLGYHIEADTDMFVMRFVVSGRAVFPPSDAIGQTLIFGSNDIDRFASFDVLKNGDGSDVSMLIAGSTLQPVRFAGVPESHAFPITGSAAGFRRVGFMYRLKARPAQSTPFVATPVRFDEIITADAREDQPVKDLPYVTTPDRKVDVDVRGGVFDPDGNAVIAGTVYFTNNGTTGRTPPSNPNLPQFYTGNNLRSANGSRFTNIFNYEGFNNGNDAKRADIFVRRINYTFGSTIWSGLLGGTAADEAGGYAVGLDGQLVNTGSCVAVDGLNNVYVTGVSNSFDFERTRGVFGEIPRDGDTDVTVTKISADGQFLVYSTYLQGVGNQVPNSFVPVGETAAAYSSNIPAGVSVDNRNYAYITGNLRAYDIEFPAIPVPRPVLDPDPVQPASSTLSRAAGISDQIAFPNPLPTGGINDPTYDSPSGTVLPTTEGYLTVLNDTATGIVFATFLGGAMDDRAYAPYVDSTSDVWVMGFTDNQREYDRIPRTGNPIVVRTGGPLPGGLISALAFKQSDDTESDPTYLPERMGYGIFSSVSHPNGTYSGPDFIEFPNVAYSRDGFVDKFRIDLASVSGLSFNPQRIPGGPPGSGVATLGTVTLSQGAPSGGGQVEIEITSGREAASLSATNGSVYTLKIPVVGNQAIVQFPVFSKSVTQSTPVSVKATFSGSFKETSFQVVPYLQSIQLSSDTVIGGDPNPFSGTVTLSAGAPVGGLQIVFRVDRLVPTSPQTPAPARPTTASITIPEGQTSGQFFIQTDGVSDPNGVDVVVSATVSTLPDVTRSAPLRIFPAQLLSVSVTPTVIASGGTAQVVVSLNGAAPPGGYLVTLETDNPTATITPSVVIAAGKVDSTPQVVTVTTTKDTSGPVKVTARHIGVPPVSTTFQVQQLDLASFTIDPATVESGGEATGTVTLKANAPMGGAKVYITSIDNPSRVSIKDAQGPIRFDSGGIYVVVPEGEKTVTFTITAGYVGTTQGVTFTIGGLSRTLTIKAVPFTFTLDPVSVIGGQSVTGTISIPAPAPAGGIQFHISTANAYALPTDANPVIQAGETSVVVTFVTGQVPQTVTNTITVFFGFNEAPTSRLLTINPIGLLSISASKSIVRGSSSAVVTIDATFAGIRSALPDDGVITFTSSQPSIVPTRTFTIKTLRAISSPTANFVGRALLPARRVARSQDVTITATYAGTTATTVVTITR